MEPSLLHRIAVHLHDEMEKKFFFIPPTFSTEPVFLNVYGAQESIPRNEFRQTM
jgi:hypothetical protein